ncbi:MFS transporter [Epilithonimonas hungarica]|uniref:Uncharacterized protein n=1 Tax=Epilithonimonas hungarica TaxID=454006 RepID=A0A1G7W0M2_9FLAO|nr:MFS transporter [Epilithonimonas hungarica]SDG64690.1 hypothetical protein SAMN05421825_3754 [Epilithonimonas hungarica]
MMSKIKKALIISLISVIIGGLQMAVFLPDGTSCIDGKSSLLEGFLFFMPIQFILVFCLSLVNKKCIIYLILLMVFIFWIFINKNEFTNRHACWSTFTEGEIIKAVLLKSSFTCSLCICALYLAIMRFIK